VEKSSENSRAARIVGMLTFVAGVVILAFVFFRAYALFSAPPAGMAGSAAAGPTTGNLATAGMSLLARIGLLFIMTLAGSLIASRGVQLYIGRPEGR
jgi:hypothetical protein